MKRVGKQPSLLSRLPGFREALELAKSRGEDVDDLLPEREGAGSPWGGLGVRRLSQAEKDRRRRREKLARQQRKKMRKRR
jgi:hypothetical protein